MTAASRHKGFFEIFPPPEFMLLSTMGVVLVEGGARFAQMKRGGLMGGSFLSLDKSDKTGLEGLKELASRHDLHYVKTSLPDDQAYIFTTTIERVPPEGLNDAVAFIIEENAPVSLKESVFDFVEVPQDDPAVIKVAVSVVPKRVVSAQIELFQSAGITPVSFDVESQAIARSVVPASEARTVLIINLGVKKTGLYVVEDKWVEFSTTFSHDPLAAEEAIIRDIKGEMRKVFSFWDTRLDRQRRLQKKIEKVFLYGERSKDAARVSALMSDFPVEHALSGAGANVSWSHEPGLDYAVAIGLALDHTAYRHV